MLRAIARPFPLALLVATTLLVSALTASAADPVRMRIGFTTKKGALTDQQVHIFAADVNKLIPGYFKIEVFPGSQLGTGTEMLQALELGTIESVALGSEGLSVDPKMALFDLPWMFHDFAALQKAVSGPLFDQIKATYDKHGIVLLAIYCSGFRDILSRKPIRKLSDAEGMRVRVAPSPARLAFFKAIKAVPVTVQWADTYLALQRGTVDAVEAFPIYLKAAKMYEQAKNLARLRYVTAPVFLSVSKAFWGKLSDKARQALVKAGRESMKPGNGMAQSEEAKDIAFMKQHGVTVVNTDLTGYRKIRSELTAKYRQEHGSAWLKMIGAAD